MGHQDGRRGKEPHADGTADFAVERWRDGETERIVVRGPLDEDGAPSLEQAIRNAEASSARLIVVDLTEVTSIDRPGLASLLKTRVRLRSFGDRVLFVRSRHPEVSRFISLTGTSEMLY